MYSLEVALNKKLARWEGKATERTKFRISIEKLIYISKVLRCRRVEQNGEKSCYNS